MALHRLGRHAEALELQQEVLAVRRKPAGLPGRETLKLGCPVVPLRVFWFKVP